MNDRLDEIFFNRKRRERERRKKNENSKLWKAKEEGKSEREKREKWKILLIAFNGWMSFSEARAASSIVGGYTATRKTTTSKRNQTGSRRSRGKSISNLFSSAFAFCQTTDREKRVKKEERMFAFARTTEPVSFVDLKFHVRDRSRCNKIAIYCTVILQR